ncbi:hypothetical protein [Chengkuizengella axinellae]|uniref:DUF3899 domain-containing protein n=1 Tax=Chengkuizengella axinellae TaxID=3064388 RepID=A0ABT9J012_9BACL|nr:hypothetical protein [Chengkuizengella sp. 2205SS18-9]MDP5274969.1 hypothetical protein [Chengkuizengella sp. 2205SS18-9]
MKKTMIVMLTMLIEFALLWGVSFTLGWALIDIIFLGGLAIFGVIWLTKVSGNLGKQAVNAEVRGWNGLKIEDEGVDINKFNLSPVLLGVILFLIISLIITIVHYWSYF